MAGFTFDPKFNFGAMNSNFGMDPKVLSEEATSANQGTISQSEEGAAGDSTVENPINPDNDPYMGLGALMTNDNFNVSSVEEEDFLKTTDEEQDEAFHRLMEMSSEEFEKIMREFPDDENTVPGPSSTTPYASRNKRVRCNDEDSASASVGGAPSTPQLGFQPQQIHQIREIREVKSRQGKAIEGLEKKVQDLEADFAKAHSEAKDAFENGRMVALLGVEGNWEVREAKLRHDAELEHERQIDIVRNFLEGQIAEKSRQLDQYRAEAVDYKGSVEGEAERNKKAAEEEIAAQKAAAKAAEGAKIKAESSLSEQIMVLESAKPYMARLEKKIADLEGEKTNWEAAERLKENNLQPTAIGALEGKIEELEAAAERTRAMMGESEKVIERLNGANKRTENARADLERLFETSKSYATDLEMKLASLEKEQSSKEAAQLQQEEELKALEDRVKDLESTTEKAARANEETQSVVGPVEQVNIEPSIPANATTLFTASPFKFAAAKELPPSQIEMKQFRDKKSQRQLRIRPQAQHQAQPQPQIKQGPEPEGEPTPPSQQGMFSRHCYPPIPPHRPRRIPGASTSMLRRQLEIASKSR